MGFNIVKLESAPSCSQSFARCLAASLPRSDAAHGLSVEHGLELSGGNPHNHLDPPKEHQETAGINESAYFAPKVAVS